MAVHSSILALRIHWTEETGGLQSMGSQRAGHDWAHGTGRVLTQDSRGKMFKRVWTPAWGSRGRSGVPLTECRWIMGVGRVERARSRLEPTPAVHPD